MSEGVQTTGPICGCGCGKLVDGRAASVGGPLVWRFECYAELSDLDWYCPKCGRTEPEEGYTEKGLILTCDCGFSGGQGEWPSAFPGSIHATFLKAMQQRQQREMKLRTELLEALISLRDVQNGPPLERYRAEWEAAMKQARAAIAKVEHAEPPALCPLMEKALADVVAERERQNAKWGEQNHDPITWVAILTEEVGEFAQSAVDHRFGGSAAEGLRNEAIQVAAVAVQIVECLDRGKWRWPSIVDEKSELLEALKEIRHLHASGFACSDWDQRFLDWQKKTNALVAKSEGGQS